MSRTYTLTKPGSHYRAEGITADQIIPILRDWHEGADSYTPDIDRLEAELAAGADTTEIQRILGIAITEETELAAPVFDTAGPAATAAQIAYIQRLRADKAYRANFDPYTIPEGIRSARTWVATQLAGRAAYEANLAGLSRVGASQVIDAIKAW